MTTDSFHNPDHPALHDHALETLAVADFALAHAPVLALSEAHTLGEVSAEWVNKTFGEGTPGAVLEEVVASDAHNGMTSRGKWTLSWNEAGRKAGLPPSIFVKATPSIPYYRETLAMLHMAELEARFYNQIQPEVPELAPAAYYARSYPGGRFLIVLEDIELRQLRPFWMADDCSIVHARGVVTALAQLHAKYWASERLLGDLVWVRPRCKRFGWTWLRDSFSKARMAYLESESGQRLPQEVASLLRDWNHHDAAIYRYWETKPPTVLHGDSHLGNTFAYPDGRAGLFDWQVMFRGYGLRELAYFLMSALTNEMRVAHERELFGLYLETLAAGGVRLETEQAWFDYCLFILDSWDAHIKTSLHGYGHADSALQRNAKTTVAALLDHDVAGLLDRLLRKL